MVAVGRSAALARRDSWQELAQQQGGMIARRQLLQFGFTPDEARQ
jgi:hypothetical protein